MTFRLSGVDGLRLRSVSIRAGLSRLFEARVHCVTDTPPPHPRDWLRKPALIRRRTDAGDRLLHGYVREITRLPPEGRFTGLAFTIVPAHWWLTRRVGRSQHPDCTPAEVITRLCREAGPETADLVFSLHRAPMKRPAITRLDESDWQFIERLLAEEGWHYTFEHTESGHRLVISDHGNLYRTVPGRYRLLETEDRIRPDKQVAARSRQRARVVADAVRLDGWDPERPGTWISARAGAEQAQTLHQLYDSLAARLDPETRARQQLDRRTHRGMSLELWSPRPDLEVGLLMVPPGHKEPWVITALEYDGKVEGAADALAGTQGDRHRNRLILHPEDSLHPPAVADRIRTGGPMTGIVWGTETGRAQTDAQGRVQVAWHWDPDARPGPHLRVDHGWAGDRRGSCVLPRAGQDVLVDFEDGHPDGGVVLGSLWHGGHRPPVAAAEHDLIRLRTAVVGTQDAHELTLDDRQDQTRLSLASAGDLRLHVSAHRTVTVEGDRLQHAGGSLMRQVDGDLHLHSGKERIAQSQGNRTSQTSDWQGQAKTAHLNAAGALTLRASGQIVIEAGTIGINGALSVSSSGISLGAGTARINTGAISGQGAPSRSPGSATLRQITALGAPRAPRRVPRNLPLNLAALTFSALPPLHEWIWPDRSLPPGLRAPHPGVPCTSAPKARKDGPYRACPSHSPLMMAASTWPAPERTAPSRQPTRPASPPRRVLPTLTPPALPYSAHSSTGH
ncbi:type VI secretion system tip protein TssI/VgrG [Hahella sp. SMD15-11]|uniref:Type VI secretion system tip protein TssI/VgrG n=1 Tax=Thermohahella caldifontis TaxID=3142973 RepID=A0AB39UUL0_9GAMM